MKRLIWLSLLLACLTLLPTASVQAISIGFSPMNQTIGAGGMGSVDIVVSNRGGTEIGGFSFDVLFDPAVISPTGVTFGLNLGDPSLFEALTSSGVVAGTASLAEVSLLSVADLQLLQLSDSFVLATLNFDALGVGVSALSFANTDFVDGFANTLTVATQNGSATVTPEPGTMVLLGSGVAGVALRRWKARRTLA
jgi:hypothetical protein